MDFILNPLVTVLAFLYSILNQDVVLAIIVFTVLIRLLVFPLTAQQMKSTAAMQVVQPELKKLQEKYKNDREKLAQEQMKLYREYGVNPLGGCLPLVIQFPILIALYQTIIHALAADPLHVIDLSGRLLIPGLSGVVPLNNEWLGVTLSQPPDIASGAIIAFALPLLVVVTTWLQFKVTMPAPQATANEDGRPNQMAAMQQSMGTIMPLMYGFFALSFSVGLSIYFIVSNIIGIVQYTLMGKADFRRIFSFGGNAASTAAPNQIEGTAKPAASAKPKNLPANTGNTKGKTQKPNRAK